MFNTWHVYSIPFLSLSEKKIIVWGVASLLKLILTSGFISVGSDLIAFGSLFTWAWLELFQGVNYFRTMLGFVVLVGFLELRIFYNNTI